MRRLAVPQNIIEHDKTAEDLLAQMPFIKERLGRLSSPVPDASVIIPAFNEEGNILKTLSSLSKSNTAKKIEIIVVNNNSSDKTASFALACGAICVDEPLQGITPARNRGLKEARGRYILNADADTIYPPSWIDLMLTPLYEENTAMVYGSHYFLPSLGSTRFSYFLYEHAAEVIKWINRSFREEAVNVYGFNSAFRREDGLMVDGFNHPPGTNEDGWLAVKLREKCKMKLFRQSDPEAMVWTSDRRILADGGLAKAVSKRIRNM